MIALPRTAIGVFMLTLRLLLGGLFVYAGWEKSRAPEEFLNSIRTFQILPDPYAAWVAMGLPWLEIAAGAAVMTGILLEGGLAVIGGMLAVFIWALAYSWQRGLNLDCGCFGAGAETSDFTGIIVRDGAMLAVTILLLGHRWVSFRQHRRKDSAGGPPVTASGH